MTDVLQGDVNVPGLGKTKKVWIYGGVGIAAAYVGWRWYQASRDGDATSDGMYNTDQTEMGLSTGGGSYNPGGNSGGDTTDGTSPDVLDTNAEWTNKAVELLASSGGFDPAAVYSALGEFLARRALDKDEATIARAAIAAAGEPPVGRPWTVLEEGGSGTGTLPAPTGLKAANTAWDSTMLSWNTVPGASAYQVFRNGVAVGNSTGVSYTAAGLTPKTAYKFAVAAVGSTGKVGAKSGDITVTTNAAPTANRPTMPGKPDTSKPKVPPYHEVVAKSGDSISKIAARYGKSWQVVWDFNLKYRSAAAVAILKARGPHKIFRGTRIWVPR